jgi:adenylate cyclase, class 2
MKHEYEAKFLGVDVSDLQTRLKSLGAFQAFPRTLLTRKIFENDTLDDGAWVRLRNEDVRPSALDRRRYFPARPGSPLMGA